MPSKNWTYCPAFPNSIALRRDIAKANQSRLQLCVHALTAGGEGGGKGSEQGIRRTVITEHGIEVGVHIPTAGVVGLPSPQEVPSSLSL